MNDSKYKKISEAISQLLIRSSAHGLPRLIISKNIFLKLIWFYALILSSALGSYFVIQNITSFLKYEATSTIDVIDEMESEFPTVSFCSSNGFSMPLNQTILSLRFNNIYQSNYDQYFEQFNDNSYGICYRFNSGKNMLGENVSIIKVNQRGSTNGLKLEMNITALDKNIDFNELSISIHNKSSPPINFNDVSIYISACSWNFFEIQRVFYQSLEYPYNDCFKDVREFKLNKTIIDFIFKSNTKYSKRDCFKTCSFLHALELSNCSCNATLETFDYICEQQWFETDNNNSIKICIKNYLTEFNKGEYKKCSNYCPTECDRLEYLIDSRSEVIPITKGNISNETKIEPSIKLFKTYENVQRGYISIFVYYDHLRYTLISQIPKTETFSFVSSIGGVFGLFLGISFLSFIEIFEIIVEVFLILIKRNKIDNKL